MSDEIDLRRAINAISDVIQNRPRPLRHFDQIYMKAGDMVLQTEFVADWARDLRLAFIGDGDAISVCVAYLQARGIIDYGPSFIKVFDFDERIVSAVRRFADAERLENLDAELYNCLDPSSTVEDFDRFYTNPPWGASNAGASATVFVQRGMELLRYEGEGAIIIADDYGLDWPQSVLSNVQRFANESGFYVSRMIPQLHSYHLDDDPNLRSCNLIIKSLPGNQREVVQSPIKDTARLRNFYGEGVSPHVRYIRERKRVDYGKAHDDEYELELFEDI